VTFLFFPPWPQTISPVGSVGLPLKTYEPPRIAYFSSPPNTNPFFPILLAPLRNCLELDAFELIPVFPFCTETRDISFITAVRHLGACSLTPGHIPHSVGFPFLSNQGATIDFPSSSTLNFFFSFVLLCDWCTHLTLFFFFPPDILAHPLVTAQPPSSLDVQKYSVFFTPFFCHSSIFPKADQ